MFKVLIISLVLVSFSSCSGTMQSARTNGQGNFQFGIEPGAIAFSSEESESSQDIIKLPRVGDVQYMPYANFSARYGVTERFDLGLRLGVFNYEVQAKAMLSDPQNESFALSLAPAFVYVASELMMFPVRVLVGIPVGENEIVIAPHGTPHIEESNFRFSAGASLAYAIKLDKVTLLPELKVDLPLTESTRETHFNVGVGILFGGR